jgi:hypothetical protein
VRFGQSRLGIQSSAIPEIQIIFNARLSLPFCISVIVVVATLQFSHLRRYRVLIHPAARHA